MSTEIIFFDIDDTLCRLGRLTENNLRALQALSAQNTVKLAIATGRSIAMLPPDIRRLFDSGMIEVLVSANGQYNMIGSEIISHYPSTKRRRRNWRRYAGVSVWSISNCPSIISRGRSLCRITSRPKPFSPAA